MINTKNIEYETLAGKSIEQSIIDQLNVLISTPVGTVPLDRDFGLDYSFIDMPTPVAESMLASELSAKVELYIPDINIAQIVLINHEAAALERLHFKVVVNNAN